MIAMSDKTDLMVFVVVVAARLIIPLFIPRFPLPAILAALVLDAADQTIFQNRTNLEERGYLEGYQSYDKALDIYYLTIAYTATMRNWGGGDLFRIGRFLWYYRLVGVLIFESTGATYRWLLLVFPNTFEYFFIAIEAFKVRHNALKLSRKTIIRTAAFIWIVIKLPQEAWIHVFKFDFTDAMKERVFGVETDDSWGTAITNRPLVTVLLIVLIVGALFAVRWWAKKLPAPDWDRTFDSDVQAENVGWSRPDKRAKPLASFGGPFIEKVLLIGFVTTIFANILPGVTASGLQIIIAVGVLIALNTLVSELAAKREVSWRSTGVEFIAMAITNLAIVLIAYALLGSSSDAPFRLGNTIFLVGLITLIVVLFDRYRDIGQHRLVEQHGAAVPV